jgi:hypothetical protein
MRVRTVVEPLRRRRLSGGTLLPVGAIVALTSLGLFVSSVPALAATCSSGYTWSGKGENQQVHEGVSATLGMNNSEAANGANHIANWVGLQEPSNTTNCINQYGQAATCMMQVGFGSGCAGASGNCLGNDQSYFEFQDDNSGYNANYYGFYGPNQIAYTDFYANQIINVNGKPLYEFYLYEWNSTFDGFIFAAAFFPNVNDFGAQVNLETNYSKSASCATTGGNSYFGANQNGTVVQGNDPSTSVTVVNAMFTYFSWHQAYLWTQIGPGAHLGYTQLPNSGGDAWYAYSN